MVVFAGEKYLGKQAPYGSLRWREMTRRASTGHATAGEFTGAEGKAADATRNIYEPGPCQELMIRAGNKKFVPRTKCSVQESKSSFQELNNLFRN